MIEGRAKNEQKVYFFGTWLQHGNCCVSFSIRDVREAQKVLL